MLLILWVWRFPKPWTGKTLVKETVFTRFSSFCKKILQIEISIDKVPQQYNSFCQNTWKYLPPFLSPHPIGKPNSWHIFNPYKSPWYEKLHGMKTIDEKNWSHMKLWFNNFPYKAKNMSQNLKHNLHVLKTENPAKSRTWFEASSRIIPKKPLYNFKSLFGGDSRYRFIFHKKWLCQMLRC